jgi:hypothetical protein
MIAADLQAARSACADPLEAAGLRLDAAAAEFDRLCRPHARLPDESAFGLAEEAFLAARDSFRRLLAARLGHDAESVARRLSL